MCSSIVFRETWHQEAPADPHRYVIGSIKIIGNDNVVHGWLAALDHCSHIVKLVPLHFEFVSEIPDFLLIGDPLLLHGRFHLSH